MKTDWQAALTPHVPTLDRPFGIALWPLFDRLYSSVMGQHADEFRFVREKTPLSTVKETTAFIVAYYVVILGGRAVMRKQKPFRLKGLFMVHNFVLTIVSAALLALFAEELLPTVWRHGLFYSICSHEGGWTKPLVTLYYLNYLVKYVELLDTVFLVLRKKPLTFLHCYHHGATVLLCYSQLIGLTAVSWVPISLNLLVHVVMYWYYFQSARGVRVWWKEWVTKLQIVQFVIDLGFVYFASYTYFTSTYFHNMPNAGSCAGEEFAAFSGMAIISSYLLLFISFYLATYRKTGAGSAEKAAPAAVAKNAARHLAEQPMPTLNDVANGVVPTANGHAHAHAHVGGPTANGSASRSSARDPASTTRSRKA
ncbi:MAG: hypothetical protein M1826_005957 [Phylliscum demangeonii]|nr:MAG: hypothetical protein M1826_005957 [Phylliscum demangeonii]